jgi:hypothetical protein
MRREDTRCMNKSVRVVVAIAATLALLIGGAAPASAGGKSSSKGSSSSSSSKDSKDTKDKDAPDPSHYEFIHEKDTPISGSDVIRIKGAKEGEEGYIVFQHVPDTQLVIIGNVKGIKGQPGAGEALKKEVLKRFPPKIVKSQLVATNRDRLLEAWGKGFPKRPSLTSLKSTVPAMKFEGFDYELFAENGLIYLEMRPGNGKVIMKDKDQGELDAILLSENPEKKEKVEEKKDNSKKKKK